MRSLEDLAQEAPKLYEALETVRISGQVVTSLFVNGGAPDVRLDHLVRIERALKFLKKQHAEMEKAA